MTSARVTKFVALSISVLATGLIVACANKSDDDTKYQRAEGVETKAGQMLSQQDWCSTVSKTKDGVPTVNRYTFDKTGELSIIPGEMQASMKMKDTVEYRGTWALQNGDQLILNQHATIKMYTLTPEPPRPLDQVVCLTMNDSDTSATPPTQTLCPCSPQASNAQALPPPQPNPLLAPQNAGP